MWRGDGLAHILFDGPAGLGNTTLSSIIANGKAHRLGFQNREMQALRGSVWD